MLAATRFHDVRWFPEIDSTNRYLLDEARAGAPEGVVAVADHQTAGRGRLGRSWEAPPGASLLVSVLLRPRLAPEQLHLVTAAVALAAVVACRQEADVVPDLKWPNDLHAGDRKLAGVLAEADLRPDGAAVVAGIGLNVNWPAELPPGLADIATSLDRVAGRPVDRASLLVRLLLALEDRYAALDAAEGVARVAAEYRRHCDTIGRLVRVQLADETFTGRALDVSDEGHLLVDVGMCVRTVAAGDVVHLRPHP